MSFLGEQILQQGYVIGKDGNKIQLHSHTSLEQCQFLQDIIYNLKPKICLETGLAFGLSTLFICQALTKNGIGKHIAIDKYQYGTGWNGLGVKHIKDAGFDPLVTFYEDYAHNILPQLHREGLRVDFAYLDASKMFDAVLVNVYFIALMLNVGGVIVLDDCGFPGIQKITRFLAKHPSFKVDSKFGGFRSGWKTKVLNKAIKIIPYSHKLFKPEKVETAEDLGINAWCVSFKKMKEDDRDWKWFEEF